MHKLRLLGVSLLLCASLSTLAQAQVSAPDFSALNARLDRTAEHALLTPNENAPQTLFTESPDLSSPQADAWRFSSALLPILSQHGLPAGLSAVVTVESHGNPAALSPKGARGLWQLMPATARRYGLIVDNRRDERLDPVRSTAAAASYLRDLHAQFGSWPLALVAYNWGEQNLSAAMVRTRSSSFAELVHAGILPAETRSYVPAVLAHWSSDFAAPPEIFHSNRRIVYAPSSALDVVTSPAPQAARTFHPTN